MFFAPRYPVMRLQAGKPFIEKPMASATALLIGSHITAVDSLQIGDDEAARAAATDSTRRLVALSPGMPVSDSLLRVHAIVGARISSYELFITVRRMSDFRWTVARVQKGGVW
jgi:hypothetical protein